MRNPIIAALDVPTPEEALKLAEQLAPVVGMFKIGSELFTSAGPDIVKKGSVATAQERFPRPQVHREHPATRFPRP